MLELARSRLRNFSHDGNINKWLCYGRGTARQLVSRNSVTTKHPI